MKPRVLAHKDLLGCCKRTLLDFAKHDPYLGGGEDGDRISCPDCKQTLVHRGPGWRREAQREESK